MLQRPMITTTCVLAFVALTVSTAAAVVTALPGGTGPGGGAVTCTTPCTPQQAAKCASGNWIQGGLTKGPNGTTATESCQGQSGITCTVAVTGGQLAGGQTGAAQIQGCFLGLLQANNVACGFGLCGKKQQFCVYLTANGPPSCISTTAPSGGR
jgi:hypothetical protein